MYDLLVFLFCFLLLASVLIRRQEGYVIILNVLVIFALIKLLN